MEVKSTINIAQASIDFLPTEILIRIFRFVLAQPCDLHQLPGTFSRKPIGCPEYLAQVCPYWRDVAFSCRSLWCHIDLSPHSVLYSPLITRAEARVARAGDLPIELHIAEGSNIQPHEDYIRLHQFISGISGRVGGLEFFMDGYPPGFRGPVLKRLISGNPTLTKLALHSNYNSPGTFVSANHPSSTRGRWNFEVDLTNNQIETAFAPLRILHLRGIFPAWSSKAFHGLVDLRLLLTEEWASIGLMELASILEASPGLQILHFGLRIQHPIPLPQRLDPVNLRDLQVVKIFPSIGNMIALRPSTLLRLLVPGSKPLRLCFASEYNPDSVLVNQLNAFFERSRVARFYSRAVFPPLNILLRHAAHLECVVLDYLTRSPRNVLPPGWLEAHQLGSLPRLRSVYITRSHSSEADLSLIVDCCPNGTVIHSSSIIRFKGGRVALLNTGDILKTFPTVRIIDQTLYPSGDPTADWDILD